MSHKKDVRNGIVCSNCKKLKPVTDFYWDKTNNHYYGRCKKCFLSSPSFKQTYLKHKEKFVARSKVRYALIRGILIKPERCEVCEETKILQGHHEDYTKPLEVVWLCRSCHGEADRKMKIRLSVLEPKS